MITFNRSAPPRTIEVNASQLIARGKVLIVEVSITGGAGAGIGVLYDGENVNGLVLKRILSPVGVTIGLVFPDGVLFERGLFVTVNAVTDFLSISYYPGAEEGVAG
jgi:hypothetical protein